MQYRITIVIEAHNPTHGYETVFDSADKVLSHEEVCRVLRGTADSIEAGNITMAEARGFTQGLVTDGLAHVRAMRPRPRLCMGGLVGAR